jgi:hypothetical protein
MKKLAIPLALLAAATLAACGTAGNTGTTRATSAVGPTYVAYSGSVPIGAGYTTRTGSGTVVALLDPRGPYANHSWQLVTRDMHDGSGRQTFAVEGVQLEFFENIRVNQDGTISRRVRR